MHTRKRNSLSARRPGCHATKRHRAALSAQGRARVSLGRNSSIGVPGARARTGSSGGTVRRMPCSEMCRVDVELGRVRALRANPPALVCTNGKRRKVFGAALEQFEQLLRAAGNIGTATAPLPLFYALSQAGRAIAAARLQDSVRWDYAGHGIKGPSGYASPIGDSLLTPTSGNRSAFAVVSEATGSPGHADEPLALGELWASLPETTTCDGLGAGGARPFPASLEVAGYLAGSGSV